ncbi:MAG: FHA domain-containing protein [Tepidisphaeraceae bacterium]|jgi:hypothetical protein
MADDKIQISWTDLKTSKVEKHVRQQQAMLRNRRYSQMTSDDVSLAQGPWPIWYNPIFLLAAFGLLGGLLAWSGGALMHLAPDRRQQAQQALASIQDIGKLVRTSPNGYGITRRQADNAIDNIVLNSRNNPYLKIEMETSLGAQEKQSRMDKLARADYWKNLITHILGFGIAGVIISICLSVAEPVIDRNLHAVVINGSVGAALGLAGGLAASLVVDRVYQVFGGAEPGLLREYLAQSVSWAVLGAFLAAAPGLVVKNRKRLLIGLAGGAVGGAVGGILLDPLSRITSSAEFGRLAALCCIGAVAGAATGILEHAARTGWLKVTAGVIAGKQFILYRDPTYIGSAPDCQIYLFRDKKVGRRHAAIHLLPGRIEIEDLPLGGPTLINGNPITRQRLCHGDRIGIGSTTFLFQEKKAAAANKDD